MNCELISHNNRGSTIAIVDVALPHLLYTHGIYHNRWEDGRRWSRGLIKIPERNETELAGGMPTGGTEISRSN